MKIRCLLYVSKGLIIISERSSYKVSRSPSWKTVHSIVTNRTYFKLLFAPQSDLDLSLRSFRVNPNVLLKFLKRNQT